MAATDPSSSRRDPSSTTRRRCADSPLPSPSTALYNATIREGQQALSTISHCIIWFNTTIREGQQLEARRDLRGRPAQDHNPPVRPSPVLQCTYEIYVTQSNASRWRCCTTSGSPCGPGWPRTRRTSRRSARIVRIVPSHLFRVALPSLKVQRGCHGSVWQRSYAYHVHALY
jgi:hypothetical protein